MLTKHSLLNFSVLSLAAPVAALLLLYSAYNWDESVVLSCLFIAGCLWLSLFSWSIWSIRHHRIRAIFGLLDCAYCLWQILHVVAKW